MDEKETAEELLARYYEERRGDMSGWKPAGRKLRSRGGVTSVFSVRFTEEELDAVEAAADREHVPVSTFVRAAALEAAGGRSVLQLQLRASQPLGMHLVKGVIDSLPLSAA